MTWQSSLQQHAAFISLCWRTAPMPIRRLQTAWRWCFDLPPPTSPRRQHPGSMLIVAYRRQRQPLAAPRLSPLAYRPFTKLAGKEILSGLIARDMMPHVAVAMHRSASTGHNTSFRVVEKRAVSVLPRKGRSFFMRRSSANGFPAIIPTARIRTGR